MKKSKRTYFTISFLLISIGCAPTKYSHVNVLENNNQANAGINVDKVWVDKSYVSEIQGSSISLNQISIDSIKDEKGITKNQCKEFLNEYLFSSPENNGVIIKQDSYKYKLNVFFTNMSPGDAASRIWAGEFGFGHANVEIQAIVENSESKHLIEIRDSRNNSGAIGLRDTGGDKGPELVKELIQQITDNILKEFKILTKK